MDDERPDLDLRMDPKLAWALRHPDRWPVDINAAPREALLRVPGFGRQTVKRILAARRHTSLGVHELRRIGARLNVARPFILTRDSRPSPFEPVAQSRLADAPQQLAFAL